MVEFENFPPCPHPDCDNDDPDNVEVEGKTHIDEFEPDNPTHKKETRKLGFEGDNYYICGECETVLNDMG